MISTMKGKKTRSYKYLMHDFHKNWSLDDHQFNLRNRTDSKKLRTIIENKNESKKKNEKQKKNKMGRKTKWEEKQIKKTK
ncbi:hypothetical protein [Methanimicrococcus stummii]|uniref:hypothetical protein n=1 Tax=Methanimicrococcus stummii TaxID=3028294 RepID=UPI00293112E9|nr:hypothetical protein [Methanimicrococcus sp. Es2]